MVALLPTPVMPVRKWQCNRHNKSISDRTRQQRTRGCGDQCPPKRGVHAPQGRGCRDPEEGSLRVPAIQYNSPRSMTVHLKSRLPSGSAASSSSAFLPRGLKVGGAALPCRRARVGELDALSEAEAVLDLVDDAAAEVLVQALGQAEEHDADVLDLLSGGQRQGSGGAGASFIGAPRVEDTGDSVKGRENSFRDWRS